LERTETAQHFFANWFIFVLNLHGYCFFSGLFIKCVPIKVSYSGHFLMFDSPWLDSNWELSNEMLPVDRNANVVTLSKFVKASPFCKAELKSRLCNVPCRFEPRSCDWQSAWRSLGRSHIPIINLKFDIVQQVTIW